MKRLPNLWLLLVAGGLVLLVVAAAVSAGLAGVAWLAAGLVTGVFIRFIVSNVNATGEELPGGEESGDDVSPEPGLAEVEPVPAAAEVAPEWGEPIALLPPPRAGTDVLAPSPAPSRRRRNRRRFRPARIKLARRRTEVAEPVSEPAPAPRPRVLAAPGSGVVVAEAITYQRGRPPVVQKIRLRVRSAAVQWRAASPGGV